MTYYKFSYCMHNKSSVYILYEKQNFHLFNGDSKGFINVWSSQYYEYTNILNISKKDKKKLNYLKILLLYKKMKDK